VTEAAACAWCERAFTPRASGGHAQRFCRSACRRAFDAAGRRWVADAISGGMLTVELLRGTASGTRALLPGVISPVPVSERRKPASAPEAPAERLDEDADLLLYALLAVQSEGWHALAAAMSDELFDRLKRWHAPRLAKNRPKFRRGAK
jgi:hypothetical protein